MAKSNKSVLPVTIHSDGTEGTIVTPTEVVTKKTIEYKYDELLAAHKTKSGMIRFLSSEGFDRGTIAKFMGIKYQFVRNVLITPIKKAA